MISIEIRGGDDFNCNVFWLNTRVCMYGNNFIHHTPTSSDHHIFRINPGMVPSVPSWPSFRTKKFRSTFVMIGNVKTKLEKHVERCKLPFKTSAVEVGIIL